jgi:glycosyltransferase involved in cell wall biosynthesis
MPSMIEHPPTHIRRRPVMHLIDSFDCGGAQKLLLLLARVTPADRYPTCVTIIQPAIGMLHELQGEGVRVHLLNRARPSILNPWRLLRYIFGVIGDIRRLCREEGTSILHCHLSDAEFTGILAGKLADIETILDTVHTPFILPARASLDPRILLRRFLIRWLLNMADWIIAVSTETGHALEKLGIDPIRLRVVENGIDVESMAIPAAESLREVLGLTAADRPLITVARLTEQKGHRYLVDAMPAILERQPHAKLLLLGEGELEFQLKDQAKELGIIDRIIFLGVRSDIPSVLSLADVFVLPSLWEGTSLALLEAMAAGKAIVATDIDGNRPIIKDRQDCLLVPPAQSAPLAAAIVHLLSDQDLSHKLGAQARMEALRRFDIHVMFNNYEHLWNSTPRKDP